MPTSPLFRCSLLPLALVVIAASPMAAQAGPRPSVEPASRAAAVEPPDVGPLRTQEIGTGGEALRHPSATGRIPLSRLAEGASLDYGTGIRRTILMGLTGAAIGAVAGGVMELADPHGEIADVWPVLLAVPGFVAGIVFSVVS